jgi:hypothetical protein
MKQHTQNLDESLWKLLILQHVFLVYAVYITWKDEFLLLSFLCVSVTISRDYDTWLEC